MPKRTMLMGVPGHVFEVPAPLTGASVSDNSDVDVRELANGGRKVYRKPVTYQTFNLNWKGTREELAPIRDLYNRRYGYPHFWMEPINAEPGGNLLPMRWSVGSQIAYMMNGKNNARLVADGQYGETIYTYLDAGAVRYGGQEIGNDGPYPQVMIPVNPGKPVYLGAEVFLEYPENILGILSVVGHKVHAHYTPNGNNWEELYVMEGALSGSVEVLSVVNSYNYDFIGIVIAPITDYVSEESDDLLPGYVTLKALELSNTKYEDSPEGTIRPGYGISAVMPTSAYDGTLVSNALNRSNYTLELTEVDTFA